MHFSNVAIIGLGYEEAPVRIASADIEARLAPNLKRLGLRENPIQELSGILARRYWDTETGSKQPSEVATLAAEKALSEAGIDREKIGVLINTSVSRDYVEPSTACLVHGNLGLSQDCMNFDVSNACLGFVNGMQIAANMIERGQIDYALIVNGEDAAPTVEKTIERLSDPTISAKTFRDNFATLTLGSGAAAMVLGRSDIHPEGHKLVGGVSQAATEYNRLCLGNVGEMITDAQALLIAGINLAVHTWGKFLEQVNSAPDDIKHMVVHQVSHPHTEKFAEILKFPKERIYRVYYEYGNMGPVGIPFVLAKLVEKRMIQAGERIALMGIGSGINCLIMAVDW